MRSFRSNSFGAIRSQLWMQVSEKEVLKYNSEVTARVTLNKLFFGRVKPCSIVYKHKLSVHIFS